MMIDRATDHNAFHSIDFKRDLDLYRQLIQDSYLEIQSSKPIVMFLNKYVFYSMSLIASRQTPPSYKVIPGLLFKIAYSIYSQFTSISGGLLPHPGSNFSLEIQGLKSYIR